MVTNKQAIEIFTNLSNLLGTPLRTGEKDGYLMLRVMFPIRKCESGELMCGSLYLIINSREARLTTHIRGGDTRKWENKL